MDPFGTPDCPIYGQFKNPFTPQRTRQHSQVTTSNPNRDPASGREFPYRQYRRNNVPQRPNISSRVNNEDITTSPAPILDNRYSFGAGGVSSNPAGTYGLTPSQGDPRLQGTSSIQSEIIGTTPCVDSLGIYNATITAAPYFDGDIHCAHGYLFGSGCPTCSLSTLSPEPTIPSHSTLELSPSKAPVPTASIAPVVPTQTSQSPHPHQVALLHGLHHTPEPHSPRILQISELDYNNYPKSPYGSPSFSEPYMGTRDENITKNQDGKYQCDICSRSFRRPSRAQTCRNGHEGIKSCPCEGLCGDPDCQAVFASKDGLRRHCAAEERKFITCDNCNTRILRQNIARHRKRCTTEEEPSPAEATRVVLPPMFFN